MWLAICNNRDCRWEQTASGKVNAELYAHGHRLEHGRKHRVHVVEVPDKSATTQDSPTDPAA